MIPHPPGLTITREPVTGDTRRPVPTVTIPLGPGRAIRRQAPTEKQALALALDAYALVTVADQAGPALTPEQIVYLAARVPAVAGDR